MKIFNVFMSIIGFILFIITIIFLFKKDLITNPAVYISIIFLFVVILTVFFIMIFANKIGQVKDENEDYDLPYYFPLINDKLKSMYGTSNINWDGGHETRYSMKTYDKEEFIGLTGERSNDRSTVNVVIQILPKGKIKIWRFVGNPGVKMINDPLYKFNPKHQDEHDILSKYYTAKGKKPVFSLLPPNMYGGENNNDRSFEQNPSFKQE